MKEYLNELIGDLQKAPAQKVVYLEGKTDVPIFFALLGVPSPMDPIHQGVYVRALAGRSGSGSSSVRERVELAQSKGYPGIFGIVDGDGEPYSQLTTKFDAPFMGPLFTWKSYSIENLLVKTGWPATWGDAPGWEQVLIDHAPYVGLNRIHRDLRGKLETLKIWRFTHPSPDKPLLKVEDVTNALLADRELIRGYDVATRFTTEVERFKAIANANLDEAHTLVDGKWLTNVYVPNRCKRKLDVCRQEWIAHAVSVGGLPEVRDLWQRITGKAP